VKKHCQKFWKSQSTLLERGEETTKAQSLKSWGNLSDTTETISTHGLKRRISMEILGNRYARIVEENKMFFPNYKRIAQESAEKELGGDYNDETNNDPKTKK
tara:strand:+ start:944 stop:1249 length:306 start_codon:yes stop_codon:yes gene_type:complete